MFIAQVGPQRNSGAVSFAADLMRTYAIFLEIFAPPLRFLWNAGSRVAFCALLDETPLPLQLSLQSCAYSLDLVKLLLKFLIFLEKQGEMREIQGGEGIGLLIVGGGVEGLNIIVVVEV